MDDFYEKLSQHQKTIFQLLHDAFLSFPEVSWKMRYKIIFYDYKSWVAYLNPQKNNAFELCFIHGQQLSAYPGLLQSKQRKMIAGLLIENLDEELFQTVLEVFSEALIIDDENFKRNKKS